MAVSLREYRAKIKSTQSMKKITRAMELIAASRIIKAQQAAAAATPYARELTRAVSALATYSNVDHPLTTEAEDPKRAAVLVITSDRGLAGAYASSALKEAERLVEKLRSVPLEDRDTWATVARQTAGAFAAWSNATEEKPGDLAAAAEALSRSAQTYRSTPPPQKIGTSALSGSAMLLAAAARGGRGTVGQAVMIRQLLRLTQSVYDASKAAEQHRQAQLLATETRARLVRVGSSTLRRNRHPRAADRPRSRGPGDARSPPRRQRPRPHGGGRSAPAPHRTPQDPST